MASEKQIAANRKNAAKSTGPRTKNGKARSKMNALRHGLATNNLTRTTSRNESALTANPCEEQEAENFEILQIIRAERTKLIAHLLDPTSPNSLSEPLRRIATLQRYDGKAYATRKSCSVIPRAPESQLFIRNCRTNPIPKDAITRKFLLHERSSVLIASFQGDADMPIGNVQIHITTR